jgi:hypothetical protein
VKRFAIWLFDAGFCRVSLFIRRYLVWPRPTGAVASLEEVRRIEAAVPLIMEVRHER